MEGHAQSLPLPQELAPPLVAQKLRRLLTLPKKDPSAYDQPMRFWSAPIEWSTMNVSA